MRRLLIFLIVLFYGITSHAQYLTTSGKEILDKNGNSIILKGVGLGGWMLQEPYMMNVIGGANNQQEFRNKIESLIGVDNTQEFYDNWLENFVTKEDIDSIASWGFNSVRLPMHYNLFTLPIEEEVQGENTWLSKGFDMVDALLNWCEDNQLYLILDLHAAPGGQGYDQGISDYDTSKPSLWESNENKQKMVALWGKLAERYKNEEWIGGYDILNEPNWNLSGAEIKNLYLQVTNSIRAHDTNHVIFIEGNWFANDFTGLTPPWDNNMVYSFHKYWNNNTQNTIQWVLDMREQFDVPLWMGESGENSNVWFKEAIKLFEENNIGWAWWPWKRIETTVSPFSISTNVKYNSVVEYFKGNASAPTAADAFQGMLELATAAKIENCNYQKGVIDAMIRQPSTDELKPYATNTIPGLIHATHYDMGSQGIAYSDSEYGNYSGSGGTSTWNKGWAFRNDGVDISTDSSGDNNSNGYSVGYVKDREWIKYTVDVQQEGYYNVETTYAANESGGKLYFEIDDALIAPAIVFNSTGGFSNFSTKTAETAFLTAGDKKLKIRISGEKEFNFEHFSFELSPVQSPIFKIIGGVTDNNDQQVKLIFNKPVLPSSINKDSFSLLVNGQSFDIESAEIGNNNRTILLNLSNYLSFYDVISVSSGAGTINSSTSDNVVGFSNFEIENLLEEINLIPGKIEAELYDDHYGVGKEETTDTGLGLNIKELHPGDYTKYQVDIREEGSYNVECRVATERNNASFSLELRNEDTIIRYLTFSFDGTGGWQNWQTITKEWSLDKGKYTLVFKPLDSEFNLNWLNFELIDDNDRKQIPGNIQAEDFSSQIGMVVSSTSDVGGGSQLGYLDDGDNASYDVHVEQQGTYTIYNRVATAYNDAKYELSLIKSDGKTYPIAQIQPQNTGGWNNWQTVGETAVIPQGNYDLVMTSINSAVNINWYEFVYDSQDMQPKTLSGKIESEDFFSHYGVSTETCNDLGGGKNISFLSPGDFTNYLVHVTNTGYYKIKARVSGYDISTFNLSLSSENKPDQVLHTFSTPETNGWQNWQNTEEATVLIKSGDYTLNFNVIDGEFNVNWFEFILIEDAAIQIPGVVQAEEYWEESGLSIENCYDSGGGQNLSYMNQGDYAKYLVQINETGSYRVKARISSNYYGGLFNLVLSNNVTDDTTLNNFQVPNTNGWQSWQTIEKEFELTEGTYEMTMNVLGNEFNLNWIDFEYLGNLSQLDYSEPLISIYPNPSNEKIFIESVTPIDVVQVFNLEGKLMKRIIVNQQNRFNISLNLPNGIYFIKFNNFGVKQLKVGI